MNIGRRLQRWSRQVFAPGRLLHDKYDAFQELLRHDKKSLELLSDLEEIYHTGTPVDWARIARLAGALNWSVGSLVRSLQEMRPGAYRDLEQRFTHLQQALYDLIALPIPATEPPYTITVTEAAAAPHLAGGKAQVLGILKGDTDFPQPRGFVITTNAGNLLISRNNLRPRLEELLGEIRLDDDQRLIALSREMREMIEKADVPEELAEECARRLCELGDQGCTGPWAVRSSGVGEDGGYSFAGQYASVLPVDQSDLLAAYKTVLAGTYRPGAIVYRIRCGLADQEIPMAALVMELIEAQTAGVIYTSDPDQTGPDDFLTVYAVAGMAGGLVDGRVEPEIHRFLRSADPRDTTTPVPVPRDDSHRAGPPEHLRLDRATAHLLAEWGLRLESRFGGPRDIEWCRDAQDRCLLLQCRPLRRRPAALPPAKPDATGEPLAPPLLTGGSCGAPGVGTGAVHILRNDARLHAIPDGSVLVLPTLPPALAVVIGRLRAVVAEGGSRASHFATVARESGLPVITGLKGAMNALADRSTVTVDAWAGRVYQGRVDHLAARYPQRSAMPDTLLSTRLKHVINLVSPLHLVDPAAPAFTPDACTSLHDLIRFAHEKGMAEMFSLVSPGGRELAGAQTLRTGLSLTMSIIDLGGGLAAETEGRAVVELQQVTSPLLQACWHGLTHPEVSWREGLAYLDWQEADRLSSGIFSLKSPLFGSYAVVARDYLHLLLRFGYHFTVLDSLAGDDSEVNYLTFRFKGGGGNYENRLRRVTLIKEVLSWAGFSARTRGDLLDARFDRRSADDTLARLTVVGFIQGKSQLLDMALENIDSLEPLAESFKRPLRRVIGEH